MIWECAEKWHIEASGIPDLKKGARKLDKYRKKVVQPMINGILHSITFKSNSDVSEFVDRLGAWYQCVGEFFHRSLTISPDKLPAIAGLAAAFDDGSMGEYLARI